MKIFQDIPTMRGDMESLGLNMIQWAIGSIPWNCDSEEKCFHSKRSFLADLESIRGLLPYKQMGKKFCRIHVIIESYAIHNILILFLGVIVDYLKYVSNLKYDEKPEKSYEKTGNICNVGRR